MYTKYLGKPLLESTKNCYVSNTCPTIETLHIYELLVLNRSHRRTQLIARGESGVPTTRLKTRMRDHAGIKKKFYAWVTRQSFTVPRSGLDFRIQYCPIGKKTCANE